MKTTSSAPIGVFDSGLGGLTVIKQIMNRLPNENITYMADEEHMPYGERTLEEIRRLALGITEFLIEKDSKIIIMACNMSSATALTPAREMFKSTPIIGMIEAGTRAASRATKSGRIGVLATTGTVESGAYTRELTKINPDNQTQEQACPRFVPIVEAGLSESPEALGAAEEYVRPLTDFGCDTIILGCTHYPYLNKTIQQIVGSKITIIDPAEEAAVEAENILCGQEAEASSHSGPIYRYYTTDSPEKFTQLGSRFLKREITNIQTILWGTDLKEIKCQEKTKEKTTNSVR